MGQYTIYRTQGRQHYYCIFYTHAITSANYNVCINEVHMRARLGKHLFDVFSIHNGLK